MALTREPSAMAGREATAGDLSPIGEARPVADLPTQHLEGQLLDRLRGGPVKLETDIKPLGVGVASEFDRGVGFSRIELCMGIRRCQFGGLIPA